MNWTSRTESFIRLRSYKSPNRYSVNGDNRTSTDQDYLYTALQQRPHTKWLKKLLMICNWSAVSIASRDPYTELPDNYANRSGSTSCAGGVDYTVLRLIPLFMPFL